jgi:hypothetical protein
MASQQSKVNQGPRALYGAHVRGQTNTLSGARGYLPINGFFGLFASSAALTGGPLSRGEKSGLVGGLPWASARDLRQEVGDVIRQTTKGKSPEFRRAQ